MRSLIVAMGLIILTASQVMAVDLVNKDNKTYQIKVISGKGMFKISIHPMTVYENICPGSCRIEVKNLGKIEAAYNQSIAIEQGRLIKE